jgi:hypothetical protein
LFAKKQDPLMNKNQSDILKYNANTVKSLNELCYDPDYKKVLGQNVAGGKYHIDK